MNWKDKIYIDLLTAILSGIMLILRDSKSKSLVDSYMKYAESTIKMVEKD